MGYYSEVGAIISVDKTGQRKRIDKNHLGQEQEYQEWFHTEEDTANYKKLVGMLKLIMGHHLNDSFSDAIGWYDHMIILYAPNTKWYDSFEDVKAWNEFWKMACELSEREHISGVFARSGEGSGDVEDESFGDEPLYDYCHTVQGINFEVETKRRDTHDEEQTTESKTASETTQGQS